MPYLGEINASRKVSWTKVPEVIGPRGQQTRVLTLYPNLALPEHAGHHNGVQVRRAEPTLRQRVEIIQRRYFVRERCHGFPALLLEFRFYPVPPVAQCFPVGRTRPQNPQRK